MNNTIEKQEALLDQFAGLALEALISKMPFYDAKGEFGKQLSQDDLTEIKKGVTKTAYEYASYMLIARKEQEEWLNKNKDYFESDLQECIGCSEKFDYEKMKQDNSSENYCENCASEMFPIMKAEYEEMVKNGEIESND